MFGFAGKSKRRIAELEAEINAVGRSQAIIEFKLDGTIITANENFLRTMGYSLSEIEGQHHSIFMPSMDRDSPAYRQFWSELGRGEFKSGLFKRMSKDGAEIWLQAAYNPIMGLNGKPIKVIKLAADVTREKMIGAENGALVQAIRRAQAVIEFDLTGKILTANENFLATMGYSLGEIVGAHHSMFVTQADRDSLAYRDFWVTLARGEVRTGEFKRVRKGGGDVWLQASYNPIYNLDGKPFKIVKFASDVTNARVESANTLGQIQALNRTQAVIEFTMDGTIVHANDIFLNAMGYTLAEVVGKHHSIFVDRAERDSPEYRSFWSSLRAGEYSDGEFKRIAKNGSEIYLRATYHPIMDLSGKPFKVVKWANVVTGQVVAREKFNGLIENVAAATHELSSSITEISSTMVRSQETANSAVQRVAAADDSTQRLNAAAQTMGRVVDLISNITQQINLLALNATIESARAGEAGRGFAVVANEVKSLANQAKGATEEIAKEINGIRSVSGDVVSALSSIKQAIDSVSAFVTSTAAAVEEQSAVTETISGNIQSAAEQAGRLWAA
jgi:methyl-accepting chemotaxis protein